MGPARPRCRCCARASGSSSRGTASPGGARTQTPSTCECASTRSQPGRSLGRAAGGPLMHHRRRGYRPFEGAASADSRGSHDMRRRPSALIRPVDAEDRAGCVSERTAHPGPQLRFRLSTQALFCRARRLIHRVLLNQHPPARDSYPACDGSPQVGCESCVPATAGSPSAPIEGCSVLCAPHHIRFPHAVDER